MATATDWITNMRLRHKITSINIILIAIALSIFGCIIQYSEFKQSLNLQISYALKENALLLTSIDYSFKDFKSRDYSKIVENTVNAAADASYDNISNDFISIVISSGDFVYSNDNTITDSNYTHQDISALTASLKPGDTQYRICKNKFNNAYYIYVATSFSNDDIAIVTMHDISSIYTKLFNSVIYLNIAMAIVLIICSMLMIYVGRRLTKPIDELDSLTDRIISGSYDVKIGDISDDEIGQLAEKFNIMSKAVLDRINALNLSIHQREMFIGAFTHEIKTPMTSIIGYAQTLLSRELSKEQQQMALNYIYSESKRLEALSMRLLELLSIKEDDLVMENISTYALATDVKSSVSPALMQKRITLIFNVDNANISCNPDLIKTVLINLLDNARKASFEDSEIEFSGKDNPDNYTFIVTDYGIGMSEETKLHIYDEFYKEDKTRTRLEGGAGLGMSIAQVIIKRHNGRIAIESQQGHGSKISIILPKN